MIIEGKATRQQNEPEDPRKRFEFNLPEKASRIPVYFALFITGIAAYLRSAFATQPDPDPTSVPPDAAPRHAAAHRHGPVASGQSPAEETDSEDDEAQDVIWFYHQNWDDGFSMVEPVSFAFTAKSFGDMGPQIAAMFPAAFNYQPLNDNRGMGTSNTLSAPSPARAPLGDDGIDDEEDDEEPDEDDEDEGLEGEEDNDEDDEDDDDVASPANRGPITTGPVRLHDVFAGQVVLIGLSQLLYGASDPDGDILTINDISATGGALVQVGAGWSFVTIPGMLGVITFTYHISDGLLETVQTASLEVVRNSVLLTPWDDVFVGTPWDDDIDGLAGNDIIDARAGNDVVVGGTGDDHIRGGDGDDQIFGGLGDDVIFGGRGNDLIGGGEGNDRLFGDEGDDTIEGNAGDDLLMGGDGNDIVDGGEGDDELDGEDGDDVLIAGAGDDVARGGAGNDIIYANIGNDDLFGDAGNDLLDGGIGDDHLSGGEGDDQLSGDQGDDLLLGGYGTDILDGGEGSDELDGEGGDDVLVAGAGDDIARGGEGNDAIHGNSGDDELFGEAGNDLFDGGDGDDTLIGGEGDDCLLGGAGDDEIDGGAGDDTIKGDAGDDHIVGGDGHDTLDYSEFTADIHLDFAAGIAWSEEIDNDLFEDVEEVIGGKGNDTFVFGDTTSIITSGPGDDLMVFTLSDETPTLSRQLMYEILDFVVGDRVHVADYEFSHKEERLEEQRFGEIYDQLEDGFESGLPIRVTHAFYDDKDHTIIEADVDRNDFYEISITLHGVNLPLVIGHYVA